MFSFGSLQSCSGPDESLHGQQWAGVRPRAPREPKPGPQHPHGALRVPSASLMSSASPSSAFQLGSTAPWGITPGSGTCAPSKTRFGFPMRRGRMQGLGASPVLSPARCRSAHRGRCGSCLCLCTLKKNPRGGVLCVFPKALLMSVCIPGLRSFFLVICRRALLKAVSGAEEGPR